MNNSEPLRSAMNDAGNGPILSSRYMKLTAAGMSVLALALLAMLAAGLFSDDPTLPSSTSESITSTAPNTLTTSSALSGGAPLHAAIEMADSEALLVLVRAGVDVDAKNVFGDSPLHAAIAQGDPEMVRILVEAGAYVNAKNVFGDPALHIAIMEGDKEMARVLVNAGANVHATNAFGDSALSRAVHKGDSVILQILAPADGN